MAEQRDAYAQLESDFQVRFIPEIYVKRLANHLAEQSNVYAQLADKDLDN